MQEDYVKDKRDRLNKTALYTARPLKLHCFSGAFSDALVASVARGRLMQMLAFMLLKGFNFPFPFI